MSRSPESVAAGVAAPTAAAPRGGARRGEARERLRGGLADLVVGETPRELLERGAHLRERASSRAPRCSEKRLWSFWWSTRPKSLNGAFDFSAASELVERLAVAGQVLPGELREPRHRVSELRLLLQAVLDDRAPRARRAEPRERGHDAVEQEPALARVVRGLVRLVRAARSRGPGGARSASCSALSCFSWPRFAIASLTSGAGNRSSACRTARSTSSSIGAPAGRGIRRRR